MLKKIFKTENNDESNVSQEEIVIGDKINYYKIRNNYFTIFRLKTLTGFSNLREEEQEGVLLNFEMLIKRLSKNTKFIVSTSEPDVKKILKVYENKKNAIVLEERDMFEKILQNIKKEEYFVVVDGKSKEEVFDRVRNFTFLNFFELEIPSDMEFEQLVNKFGKNEKIIKEYKDYYVNDKGEYVSFLNLVKLLEEQKPFYFRGLINSLKNLESETNVQIKLQKMAREEAIKILEKSKRELKGRHKFDKSEKGQMNQSIVFYQIDQLLQEVIAISDTTLLRFDLRIKFCSSSLEKLKEDMSSVISSVKSEMKLATFKYEMNDEVVKWNIFNNSLKAKNEISISNFKYSFWFDYFELIKENGYLKNINNNEIISIDYFYKDEKNRSGNGYIFGTTGSGKSTEVKRMIKDYISSERKIFSIDQDKEYNKLCEYFEGEIVKFGTKDSSKYINPLFYKGDIEEIGNHIKFVSLFLKTLYKEKFTGNMELELEKVLYQIYKKLENKNFEITFKYLYKYLKDNEMKEQGIPEYEDLIKLLDNLIIMYPMFCKKNTLNDNSNYINFDISETKDNVELNTAILFLIVNKINQTLYANQSLQDSEKTPIMVIIDEAHRMFSSIEARKFIIRTTKEIRKYEGIIWMASQSLRDCYDETSSADLKSLFELLNYKIVLKQSSSMSSLMENTLGMTPSQIFRVVNAEAGEGVIYTGEGIFSFSSTILPKWLNIFNGGK